MSKETEMVSQQELSVVTGKSKTTICRIMKQLEWIPTIDRRNNHAKCYPVKAVSDYFKISQSEIIKRVRKHRIELGQNPSRKLPFGI